MADRAKQIQQGLSKEEAEKQLAKLAEQAKDLEKLDQLAQSLGECSKCLGDQAQKSMKDNKGSAVPSLDGQEQASGDELQKQLSQAESVLQELAAEQRENDSLDQMLDQVGHARGEICKKGGNAEGDHGGNGKEFGRGHRVGDRAQQLENGKTRNTHARGQLTDGKSNMGGKAVGQNVSGQSQIEIEAALPAAERLADDAMTRQPIPTEYKEHTRDYFQGLHGQLESKK